ncbi:MAG: hypothetical protein NZM38_01125 [Cytophagales bacterium]|nr:hypothetical protein [Cytophagales bacterium]MDW8383351.1 hypothetical protein [Flammeovirgaceae bacterium]
MKSIFTVIFYLFPICLFAQVHAGGKGDGYAAVHLKIREIASLQKEIAQKIWIAPNPIESAASFQINGVEQIYNAILINPVSTYTYKLHLKKEGNSFFAELPALPSGIYYLQITSEVSVIKKIFIL